MTELEKAWQDIDRAIGYIQGFMPTIYALDEVQTSDLSHDIVSIESIIECENVVKDLATQTARLRELYEKNAEVSYASVRIDGDFEYLKCEYDVLGNERMKAAFELGKMDIDEVTSNADFVLKLSKSLGIDGEHTGYQQIIDRLITLLGGDDGGADIRDSVLGLRDADIHDRVSRQMEGSNGKE